jgi:CCR4-NOT transcription complex subunit 3
MSKSRQIQQEIEKKLQQVEEGSANFGSILKKLQGTVNAPQKERLENELKKEIKRLQKIRESLKALESQEPRLRQRMVEAKKKIEELMEVHKQSERDSKVKAFSREGLSNASRMDPQEESRNEMREMIKNLQGSIQDKINMKEGEIERYRSARTRPPQFEEANRYMRAASNHLDRLEQVLRLVENDSVTLDTIWSINEKFESFLKEEDLQESEQELENIYKSLNLSSKILQNFPSLNDEEHDPQKRALSKKQENKPLQPVAKTEIKPVEKGWNSKEAYVKIAGKPEKVLEDLPEEDIENVESI